MKNKDLYSFKRGLDQSEFTHPRITYAINKNKRKVIEVLRDIEKTKEPDAEYKKFEEERSILAEHYAIVGKNGKKIIEVPDLLTGENQFIYNIPDIENEKSDYRKELSKLEKKYKSAIDKNDDKLKKFKEFLEDENEFIPHMIDLELLEQHETCPQKVMDKIFWMINEPKT